MRVLKALRISGPVQLGRHIVPCRSRRRGHRLTLAYATWVTGKLKRHRVMVWKWPLLIALAQRRALEIGLGMRFPIRRSRFAQAVGKAGWTGCCDPLGLCRCVEFEDLPTGRFDLAICITGAICYMKPIRAVRLGMLKRDAPALRPDGFLLLELYRAREAPPEFRLTTAG